MPSLQLVAVLSSIVEGSTRNEYHTNCEHPNDVKVTIIFTGTSRVAMTSERLLAANVVQCNRIYIME